MTWQIIHQYEVRSEAEAICERLNQQETGRRWAVTESAAPEDGTRFLLWCYWGTGRWCSVCKGKGELLETTSDGGQNYVRCYRCNGRMAA